MDILSLPSEILPTVFGFLSLEDRKKVRLACRSFRDACDRADIAKRERFVFHLGHFGEYNNTSNFVEHIGECKRICLTVEFRAVDLTRLPLRLWENLGSRVTSLLVDHCRVNDEVLAGIFLHCSELVDLHVNVPDKVKIFTAGRNSLDQLIRRGIDRVKLRTFKLFTRRSLSDNVFRKIFKIFPNIKTFGRGPHRRIGSKIPYYSQEEACSSQIELPPSVENVVYSMHANSAWLEPYIDQPTFKFKKLEFMLLIVNDTDMKNVMNFFSNQTELETIDLTIVIFSPEQSGFLRNIIFQIITKLPKLTEMKFHANCEIEFNESQFAEFITTVPKNIKLLDISPMDCTFEPTVQLDLPTIDFRKLTYLRLDFEYGFWLQLEILKRCCSLQCLGVLRVTKEILECIVRDHTKLKKLSLDYSGWYDASLLDENFSLRLPNLERLDIRNLHISSGQSSSVFFTFPPYDTRESFHPEKLPEAENTVYTVTTFVSKLDCPKLKVFRCAGTTLEPRCRPSLGPTEEDAIKMLNTLSQKAPLLETLILKSLLPVNQYYKHIKNFRKLRFIAMSKSSGYILPLTTDEVQILFEACGSLTIVVNDTGESAEAHFYNRTTQEVVTYYHKSYKKLSEIMNIPFFF